jgi:1-acyl-sn-glycerol-3-phosphate acyltransferase
MSSGIAGANGSQADAFRRWLDGHRRFRRATMFVIRLLMKILYRVRYEGLEHLPQNGPVILVGNHTSLVDIPAVHAIVKPWIHWVAKKELFSLPAIGFFFDFSGSIPVDREKADLHAAKAIFGALAAGRAVGMFPQGTRVLPENILTHLPRTGVAHFAIKTGAPLLPFAIDGQFRLFKPIRLVFGPAFRLDADSRRRYDSGELMQFTEQTMKRVYSLVDIDYQLASSALLADGLVRRADGSIAVQSEAEQAAAALLTSLGQSK